ncbi:MAG: hypothetical protein ISS15_06570 [Alphaproteobacteria bacterium]|nr:hypothetical protein [Alphaproteobacteria bacterium]MBL7097302.1 hypothetical protein [Alphaproteobacteria bacterium]
MKPVVAVLAAALLAPLPLAAEAPPTAEHTPATITTTSATPAAPNAYDLYVAGRFDAAMKAGEASNSALGFVTAARAALADAQTRAGPCLDCLKRAEDYARKAIALDNSVSDAHVYLAVAMGYEARIVGPVWARAHNYPGQAKDELDMALRLNPKNAWALGALGGWNIEIVRTGGARLASWIYGATDDAGLAAFASAFRQAPDNLTVRYQYALSLSGYDLDRFRPQIDDALAKVASLKPVTAYERTAQHRAAELASLLKKGDRDAFDAMVRRYQGYPP